MKDVTRELGKVLTNPIWEDIAWFSVLDVFLARDGDVVSDLLDEHLALTLVKRSDWQRMQFFRTTLTPAHRGEIIDALEAAPRHGLVELLALTCDSSRELKAALRKAGAGKELQPAIDYASRRFVGEPAVRADLLRRAKPFATTAARGKWKTAGEQAWRALFVTDTRESADAMHAMVAATWVYTNLPMKERVCAAAAKRTRLLAHGKRALPTLVTAMQESYTREEITLSAAALGGKAVLRKLEAKWAEYSQYGTDNSPARTTLGGLLALAPRTRAYHEAARKTITKMLRDDTLCWEDVGMLGGIVEGIAVGRIRALDPVLAKVARWKYQGNAYDPHAAERAELAAELVRRRARRALDAG